MKIKFYLCFIFLVLISGRTYSQIKRDTVYVYDTVVVKVKRPAVQENFYQVDTATFSKDSINEETTKISSFMNLTKKQANQVIKKIALGSMAVISTASSSVGFAKASVDVGIKDTSNYENVRSIESSRESQFKELNDGALGVDLSVPKDTVLEKVIVQREEDDVPLTYFPVYLSFAYPLGIYGAHSENYTYSFAFSVLSGAVGGIDGIQVAGIYNQVNGNVKGVQVGGIFNVTQNIQGVQVAGISNFTKDVKGIQVGGILNQSNCLEGVQVAGIVNITDDVDGVQVAGIKNAANDVKGIQVAGISNQSNDLSGIQVGFVNVANQMNGLQVGFINKVKKMEGLQVGFINKIDTLGDGLPIGFLNIVKNKPYFEIEALYSFANATRLNFRFGTPIFHTILGGGIYFTQPYYGVEFVFGCGNEIKLAPNLYWQSEILSAYVMEQYADIGRSSLSTGLAYYIGDRLGLKAKVGVYNLYSFKEVGVPLFATSLNLGKSFYVYERGALGFHFDLGVSLRL